MLNTSYATLQTCDVIAVGHTVLPLTQSELPLSGKGQYETVPSELAF